MPVCKLRWWEEHVTILGHTFLEFPDYSKLPIVRWCDFVPVSGGILHIKPFCTHG
jgi:hypothetical protein